jgi:transcriptional antiterminator RfaH
MTHYDARPTPVHYVASDALEHRPEWYIVCTRAHQERSVYDALQRKGFSVYLPMELKFIRPHNRRQVAARPLFPRYVFVSLFAERPGYAEVRKTNHVMWFVTNIDRPIRVRDSVIEALREAEEAGMFDKTRPKPKTDIPFKAGDKAMIKAGSFAGFVAEIASCPSEKRINLLISVMGRQVSASTRLANLDRMR